MGVEMLGGPRRFELPAKLTIEVLGDFGDALRDCAGEPGALELDGARLEAVDTAGLQWLAVLVQARRAAKRATRWDSASATLIAAAKRLGLTQPLLLARARVAGG